MMGFYNNLSDDGVIFFWVVVVLLVLLNCVAVILYIKNKKLLSLLDKKNNDIDLNSKDKKDEENKEENVELIIEPEVNIAPTEVKNEQENKDESEIVIIDNAEKKDSDEVKQEMEISTPRAYQHNVLRELSKKMPISPIHVDRSDTSNDVSIYTVQSKEEDLEDDFPAIADGVSPLEDMEDRYETNDNMKFAQEIVEKMEGEVKPSNIELTDYEKKQEEEAIISYDELQKVKDKIYNITEDEETDEFIDELKSLRDDLE